MEKTIMENGIHYTLVGDYYFPTCTLQDQPPVIGKWAHMYERWLEEYDPSEYTRLIWANQLKDKLTSVQEEMATKLTVLIRQMAKAEGVTEDLKAKDQVEWVRRMNSIRSRAEEIISLELVSGGSGEVKDRV